MQGVQIARVLKAVLLKRSEGVGVRKAVNRRRRGIPGLRARFEERRVILSLISLVITGLMILGG